MSLSKSNCCYSNNCLHFFKAHCSIIFEAIESFWNDEHMIRSNCDKLVYLGQIVENIFWHHDTQKNDIQTNDTQHNDTAVILNVELCYCYAECCYAECCYAECCYAECCYAECYYAECDYAECCYAECDYAERRGVYLSKLYFC